MRTLFAVIIFVLLPFIAAFAQKANAAQTQQIPVEQTPTIEQTKKKTSESVVYICDSKTSYAYHSSTGCKGLGRCTHGIVKIDKKEADQTRTPCKWCY